MKSIVLVFLGGGFGSVVRYSLSKWISTLHSQAYPWGTWTTNVLACLLLGFIVGAADHRQLISPSSRLFWAVGFCGGFSTFSTFSHETITLIQGGFTSPLLWYIAASLIVCTVATFAGLYVGEHL